MKWLKVVYWVVGIFIALIFYGIVNHFNNVLGQLILSIYSFFFTLGLTLWVAKILFWLSSKLEELSFKKEKKSRNLYQWTTLEFDDLFLYRLLHSKESKTEMKNLLTIKEALVAELGNNIKDYYLFKGYLVWVGKNSVFKNFGLVVTTVITSFITTLFTQKGVFDKLYIALSSKTISGSAFIEFIQLTSIIISLSVLIIVLYSELTKTKRQLELVKMIIEEIIKDLEKEVSA